MTCTRCGGQIPAGTHLCTACGAAALPPGPARSGRHIAIAVAALVVAAAITGTAVAFAHSGVARRAAGRVPAGQHRTPGTVATMPQAGDAPTPGSGAATPVSPATSPATGPSASPSGSAGAAGPLVAVAPTAAAGPHEVAVLAFLTRYFTAINHHRYRAYLRLYSRQSRGRLSAAQFEAGYGTTRDARPTLVGLDAPGRGQLAATVMFTSHQRADTSPQHAACVRWTITLYLVRDGRRYVLGDPPADYAASGRPC